MVIRGKSYQINFYILINTVFIIDRYLVMEKEITPKTNRVKKACENCHRSHVSCTDGKSLLQAQNINEFQQKDLAEDVLAEDYHALSLYQRREEGRQVK